MPRLTEWEGRTVGAWAELWNTPRPEAHDRITSTNDRALELAARGASAFTAVLADEQTRGRGRGGNRWVAPAGSALLISVVLPDDVSSAQALPLVVGIAAARAVESVVPDVHVSLKWPNDLFLGDAKVGGILCERVAAGPVVVGVGLNILTPAGGYPGDIEAVSVEEASHRATPSRGAVATALMAELQTLLRHPVAGFPPHLRTEYARRDLLHGRRVVTNLGEGTARGVDEHGALILGRSDGTEARVVSGSVRIA